MKDWVKNVLIISGVLTAFTIIYALAFTGLFLFIIIVGISWWLKGQFPIRQFGYEVTEGADGSWPVIYETNLDLAFGQMLAARLRAEDIPVIVENENLFNSGINWEFGLSVPLRIRVPEAKQERAHDILNLLKK